MNQFEILLKQEKIEKIIAIVVIAILCTVLIAIYYRIAYKIKLKREEKILEQLQAIKNTEE